MKIKIGFGEGYVVSTEEIIRRYRYLKTFEDKTSALEYAELMAKNLHCKVDYEIEDLTDD